MVSIDLPVTAFRAWLNMIHGDIYCELFRELSSIQATSRSLPDTDLMVEKEFQRQSAPFQRQLIEMLYVIFVNINGCDSFYLGRNDLIWADTTVFEYPLKLEVHARYAPLGVLQHLSGIAELVE